MRAALACVLLLLSSCAARQEGVASLRVDLIVVGRVTDTEDVASMFGSIITTEPVYTIAPVEKPDATFDIRSDVHDCPAAKDPDQLYLFMLKRKQLYYMVQGNRGSWSYQFVAISCIRIDQATANDLAKLRSTQRTQLR
jgi:hypothetical protein